MHTYTPANSMFDDPTTNLTFDTEHFDRNPFTCLCEGGKKALMVSNLALLVLVVVFLNDGMASMAVRGLSNC